MDLKVIDVDLSEHRAKPSYVRVALDSINGPELGG